MVAITAHAAPASAGQPSPPTSGTSARSTILDGYAINRRDPAALTTDLQQILAGPPAAAAATLRAAAEGGVVQAQLVYGQWLLDGHGVTRDPEAAFQWFQHASRQGAPMALNMLGQCHAHGWGTPVNALMAVYWYRLSALGGLDWGMYNYATALTLAQGVACDRPTALAWFRKAADLGHAKSMNMVGSFYEDGWVVAQDLAQAAHHYLQAAQGGDFRGQFNTARLLILAGQVDVATHWLHRIPQTATPAFLHKAQAWVLAIATQRPARESGIWRCTVQALNPATTGDHAHHLA
ncbi:MAG TPA: tetratricopeptide repeat protein [Castellaniella sp.]|uniref:tetratricopeptide repeat protein n=1 Tax=Castellaniella sp. TaxID=1955812 RepID=UPI002F1F5920